MTTSHYVAGRCYFAVSVNAQGMMESTSSDAAVKILALFLTKLP
jgi:hypothetical protein